LTDHPSRTKGIFYGWWVVGISVVGISASPAPFVFSSIGLFMKPFAEEFGWTRTEVSTCITVLTVSIALCLPAAGRLLDRYGTRSVLLPSMLVLGLCLAAIPQFVRELWHLALVFFLIGSLGVATNTVSYMQALTAWFDKFRGLAIGIAMSGMGIGFMYVPVIVQFMIDNFAWRAGYYALAAIILLVAMPLVFLGMKDSPEPLGLKPDGAGIGPPPKSASKLVGLNMAEILRTRQFWMLIAIFVLMSLVIHGLLTHLVPLLTDRGMPASTAALVASCLGAAVFIGRIIIGYLIDRFFAPYVAVFFFSLSAFAVAILASGAAGPMALLAAILIGFSYGAELDFMAYLASRYFGLRSFGTSCGLLLASVLVGASVSPVVYALWFDRTGSYIGILALCIVINILAVVVTALLGPFPDWEQFEIEDVVMSKSM